MTGSTLFVVAALVVLLSAGVWIGLALASIGLASLQWFSGTRDFALLRFLANDFWGTATSQELLTLPLFVYMGELLYYTRTSEKMFSGLAPWTTWLPGRLVHVNVLASTIFGSVSGSSAATAATVGRITLSELFARGYDRGLAMGSLAGAGTLGLLVPPSIPMIVYGVLADVSIVDVFIAGVIPGFVLAGMFMLYIVALCLWRPGLVPAMEQRFTWRDRAVALGQLLPVTLLILLVIGSLIFGWASITESAAVGVAGSFLIAISDRTLSWDGFVKALLATVRLCAMIGLIIGGALFMSKAVARLGLPQEVALWIEGLHLGRYGLVAVLLLFYLLLGCVLDGLSAIVMTLPVALPLVKAAGFDELWFGIFIVLVIEMAQVHPPLGFNLFVIQGLTGEKLSRVALASWPYVLIMIAFTLLIAVYPEIVTWLPRALKAH